MCSGFILLLLTEEKLSISKLSSSFQQSSFAKALTHQIESVRCLIMFVPWFDLKSVYPDPDHDPDRDRDRDQPSNAIAAFIISASLGWWIFQPHQ